MYDDVAKNCNGVKTKNDMTYEAKNTITHINEPLVFIIPSIE